MLYKALGVHRTAILSAMKNKFFALTASLIALSGLNDVIHINVFMISFKSSIGDALRKDRFQAVRRPQQAHRANETSE